YLLEALASGLPVVAPRHGAFPEMLARTGGGVLFAPNDVAGLGGAILSLEKDPARAARLGRRRAAGGRGHYWAGRMAEAALSLYESLTREPPRSALAGVR